jgi:4-hydroxythreonine-4-phosphate dehydrogenase
MGAGLLAVTPGDPDGIGPEVTWKAIRKLSGKVPILCIGARAPFEKLRAKIEEVTTEDLEDRAALVKRMRKARGPRVFLFPAPTPPASAVASVPGFQSGWSIVEATRLALSGFASALVTGPISKERLQAGGFRFPGHTEFLAQLAAGQDRPPIPVTMMLANDLLRVSLVTIHLALKDVPAALDATALRTTISQTAEFLRQRLGIRRPRIAVAALNPHAGEAGLFGDEEARIIAPELERLSSDRSFVLSGPHPADTLFAKHFLAKKSEKHDAIVCMYHDQGLIPVKLLDFKRTVNITLGLPFVRTSVDHGVGFDIAGKGRADPSSMISAIEMAIRLV